MTYELRFLKPALEEWRKLDARVIVVVVAIGRRDRDVVYLAARTRGGEMVETDE